MILTVWPGYDIYDNILVEHMLVQYIYIIWNLICIVKDYKKRFKTSSLLSRGLAMIFPEVKTFAEAVSLLYIQLLTSGTHIILVVTTG